jgi:hypothetical protein
MLQQSLGSIVRIDVDKGHDVAAFRCRLHSAPPFASTANNSEPEPAAQSIRRHLVGNPNFRADRFSA